MTAWVVRSGKNGEREAWAIANNFAGTGWIEFPDLTPAASRLELADLVAHSMVGVKEGAIANYVGQLWALRHRIQPGDLMVLPLKTTKRIAFGRVSGSYQYRSSQIESDPALRHVIPVDWLRTDVPRSAVKQDLLYTLGSALTVFAPTKNDASQRLERIAEGKLDPGRGLARGRSAALIDSPENTNPESSVDEPELAPDPEETARIQITERVAQEFAGHALADLVAALLTVDGFVCRTSPPGADGGVDIIAGRGVLGLDDPLVIVQVKSGSQVGAPVVQQLHGAMTQHGATQGLLVSWGGVTKPARLQLDSQRMRVRLWEAENIIDAVLAQYDRLSDDIRSRLPLKRVWMPSD